MRLALAMLLSATILVGSASANCAWVLWLMPEGTPQGDPEYIRAAFATIIDAAYVTRQECEAGKRSGAAIGSNALDAEGKAKAWVHARQVCLPDTVDPRRPK